MTNTIPNVPRELLERASNLAFQTQHYPLHDELRALLSAQSPANHVEDVRAMVADPSPAGVDGLDAIGYATESELAQLLDPTMPTGKCVRIALDHPTCWLEDAPDEHLVALCVLSDAQAIIDGQLGEVAKINGDRLACWAEFKVMTRACLDAEKERDQQDQRIGELEGLLREVAATLAWIAHGECRAIHDGPIMPSQMALDVAKAALSAGHEPKQCT